MRVDTNYINNPHFYDLIIIGSGPAGLTAAIYGQRANLKTAFIEKDTPGGKVVKTGFVENYPGFEKINGPDLAMNFFKQATSLGSKFIYGEVINIFKVNDIFHVTTSDNMVRYSKAVIIASGMSEKKLGVEGETKYYGRGVSYCAVCDAALYKNKTVAVIGGGNTALEESLFLADIVGKVYLIHRRQGFRADESVIERVKNNKKIELILDTIPTEFIGDGKKINSIKIKNVLTNEESVKEVDCIFPFIGFIPVNNFFGKLEIKNENGFIIADENMQTNVEGLFCAGDILSKHVRQISTAVSDGTIAALSAKKFIEEKFE